MTKPDNGGMAFPRAEGPYSSPVQGMSLRDYFAGQALAGLLGYNTVKLSSAPTWHGALAEEAYSIADAMIAARKEPFV